MQLRRLDQAAQPVARPRRQCPDQKKPIEDRDVFLRRYARQSERRAEACIVYQLTGMLGQDLQKARQSVELIDIGNVTHVTVQDLGDIIFEPRGPAGRRRPAQCFRIAAP